VKTYYISLQLPPYVSMLQQQLDVLIDVKITVSSLLDHTYVVPILFFSYINFLQGYALLRERFVNRDVGMGQSAVYL
jgi:uncharacterized protein YjaZ